MHYKPFCTTEIEFINTEELKMSLLNYTSNNVVLIMSESSAIRWNLLSFIEEFNDRCLSSNQDFTWIKVVPANPTQNSVIQALEQIGNRKTDIIIAFGGGSSIDLAKALSAFNKHLGDETLEIDDITNSIKNKTYINNEFIDIIAVPSTAGTGSEITQWATIWDENKNGKFSIDASGLNPKKAFIVPELTLTVPTLMTLSTGLDTMCQAIEAYWSKHTTPIVQEIAYRSVEIVINNLRKCVIEPNDIHSREQLCNASVLAGLAFSQTRTTACHSISYPLTMLHDIPHGLAVAISLDAVAKINTGHYPNDKQLIALFDDYQSIKNWLDLVCDGIVDLKLSSFGVTNNDIPTIVDNAFTGGRMDNNPVDLTRDDVRQILEMVM